MKLLLDNNVPTFLRTLLAPHTVSTAAREGWAALANGKLLSVAEASGFDLLVTLDKGFQHQQNMSRRTIAIVIIGSSHDATDL
ncbi:hypothetical protein BH11ARM2_BH11ARM2_03070 [soil metagenome]